MADLNLEQLGLSKRWPRLAQLQRECSELGRRHAEATGQVRLLEGALQQAISLDVDREAAALRSGEKPKGKPAEPEAQVNLDKARHTATVLQRALEKAQGELSEHMSRHGDALFKDVLAVRAQFAREAAEGASKALAAFGKYSDLKYVLKDLSPPDPDHGNFPAVVGVMRTSGEVDRGQAEAWLRYFIDLGASTEGKTDAA